MQASEAAALLREGEMLVPDEMKQQAHIYGTARLMAVDALEILAFIEDKFCIVGGKPPRTGRWQVTFGIDCEGSGNTFMDCARAAKEASGK